MLKEHIYPVRLTPMTVMAHKLLGMLERRTFKAYHPLSARVLVNVNHYFPALFRFLFSQFLRRQGKVKKGISVGKGPLKTFELQFSQKPRKL